MARNSCEKASACFVSCQGVSRINQLPASPNRLRNRLPQFAMSRSTLPTAQLSVDPSLASISGVGSRRRVVVPHPTLNTSITLVATAEGFQELRREVNLRPGGAESIALKLESIPGWSKSVLDTGKPLPGSGTTTPPDSTDRTQAQGAIEWKLVSTIGNSGSDIYGLALNHDGSRVAAGGADRTLQVWEREPAPQSTSRATERSRQRCLLQRQQEIDV